MKAERDIYMELFNISINTYYLWKKQGRPIISLLEKYFTKEDLGEFLKTGKIKKLDKIVFSQKLLANYYQNYFNYIKNNFGYINTWHSHLLVYYFKYLFFIKNNFHEFETNKRPFYAAAVAFGFQYDMKLTENEKSAFYQLFMLLDFLDSDKNMWYFFIFALEDNFEYFIENIDINNFIKNDKIDSGAFCGGSPLAITGVDHYYLFHCINNIHPYSQKEIGIEWCNLQKAEEAIEEAMDKTAKRYKFLQSKPEQTQTQADFISYNIGMLSSLTKSRSGWFTLKDKSGADVSFATSKTHGYPLLINEQDTGIPYETFSSLMQSQDMASEFGNALAALDLTNKEDFDFIIAMLINMKAGL